LRETRKSAAKCKKSFPRSSRVAPTPYSLVETLKRTIQQSCRPVLELSKEAGVSKNLVTQFLSGDRDIPITTASRLASVLGLKLTVD
jgi:plasmid maintenance system antidote protein VapI